MIHLSSPITVTIPAGNEVKAALANSRCAVAIMGAPRTRAEALDAMRAVGNLLHGIHRHLVVVDGENGLSMDELDVVLRGKNRPIILGSRPFSDEVLTSVLFSLNLLFQVCQYICIKRCLVFLISIPSIRRRLHVVHKEPKCSYGSQSITRSRSSTFVAKAGISLLLRTSTI